MLARVSAFKELVTCTLVVSDRVSHVDLLFYSRRPMQFHTKLKRTSTGNNAFLFIPHTKPKKLLCNKYSDIRFWTDF